MKLEQLSIPFERKDPLNYALINNRFRRVDQGIGARNHWTVLKELRSITERFTESEIRMLDQIISEDEKNRLSILNKVLARKIISASQYLKFGECMAYFENCELFMLYLSVNEKKSFSKYGKTINLSIKNRKSYFLQTRRAMQISHKRVRVL